MGVQVLADMSYGERKLALERYTLLEPHSQNGRELRSVSKLYSRIGFVHEFRPLGAAEVQDLLERCWTPPGVTVPDSGLTPEVVARVVRMTGGNLRLLTRLLTQVERVLGVNDAQVISVEIVEAARDSLVIGKPETRRPTTNNFTKTTTNNSSPYSRTKKKSPIDQCHASSIDPMQALRHE
jgi:Holliday junction resolvasome RuvABC ATP-dependent DNA helicase subunit